MLVMLLNKKYTYANRFLDRMGFPIREYAVKTAFPDCIRYGGVDDEPLSAHARERLDTFRENEVQLFSDIFLRTGKRFSGGVILLTLALAMVGFIFPAVFIVELFTLGFFIELILFLLVIMVPLEAWSAFALSRQKLIMHFSRDKVAAGVSVIMDDNRADLELKQRTEELVEDYKQRLTASDITCSEAERVHPDADSAWRVVDVQYHNIGKSPFDRDATITLTSDEVDGVTCVLPSKEMVMQWLDKRLETMRSRVIEHTHTYDVLKHLRAADILADVWQPPSQILSEVAKMVTSSKVPFADRAPVELYGQQLENGHIMVKAIGFEGVADGPGLMFAPTEPIVQLSSAVTAQLEAAGDHPALVHQAA